MHCNASSTNTHTHIYRCTLGHCEGSTISPSLPPLDPAACTLSLFTLNTLLQLPLKKVKSCTFSFVVVTFTRAHLTHSLAQWVSHIFLFLFLFPSFLCCCLCQVYNWIVHTHTHCNLPVYFFHPPSHICSFLTAHSFLSFSLQLAFFLSLSLSLTHTQK